jgi:hypothetical protein
MIAYHQIRHRIAGAVEYLRTGRVESCDDYERVNQVMHERGIADRAEAYDIVADELFALWEDANPSSVVYWEPPQMKSHS